MKTLVTLTEARRWSWKGQLPPPSCSPLATHPPAPQALPAYPHRACRRPSLVGDRARRTPWWSLASVRKGAAVIFGRQPGTLLTDRCLIWTHADDRWVISQPGPIAAGEDPATVIRRVLGLPDLTLDVLAMVHEQEPTLGVAVLEHEWALDVSVKLPFPLVVLCGNGRLTTGVQVHLCRAECHEVARRRIHDAAMGRNGVVVVLKQVRRPRRNDRRPAPPSDWSHAC